MSHRGKPNDDAYCTVYAGADVEVAATGTLTTTDVTKAIGGAGLNWTDLHASRSTNKTNLKLNL